MNKVFYTILTIFIVIILTLVYLYYSYVLDIEYHSFKYEEGDYILELTTPVEVKRFQKFEVIGEMTYVGEERKSIELENPAVRVSIKDEYGEYVLFNPRHRYERGLNVNTVNPGQIFFNKANYHINNSGTYTVHITANMREDNDEEITRLEMDEPIKLIVK